MINNMFLPKTKMVDNNLVNEFINILQTNTNALATCLEKENLNCHQLLLILGDMDYKIGQIWLPLKYFMSVSPTNESQQIFQKIANSLSKYAVSLGQNKKLYDKISLYLADHKIQNKLNSFQLITLKKCLLSFELSGIHLSSNTKEYYNSLQQHHLQLIQKFENNQLNSTDYLIEPSTDLSGIPPEYIVYAEHVGPKLPMAENISKLILSCAHCRKLRHRYYAQYYSLTSDQSNNNSEIITQLISTRHKIAKTLGYNNYVEFIMQNMNTNSSQAILDLLYNLVDLILDTALFELKQLSEFAKTKDDINELKSYDLEYYIRLYSMHKLEINDTIIREYFPFNHVFNKLIKLCEELFNLSFKATEHVALWDPLICGFYMYDNLQNCIGLIYFDLFSRELKKQGSWTEILATAHIKLDGSIDVPVATVNCNFKAIDNNEYLLTPDDLRVLFHELGHALHHILAKNDYSMISGMSGLSLDTNEVLSLFFEQWYLQSDVLQTISQHYLYNEPLPQKIITALQTYKQFPAAIRLLQRAIRAIYDLELHLNISPDHSTILPNLLKNNKIPNILVDFNPTSFSLIFSQGYAGRYYSYIWSEIIACGLMEQFLATSLYDQHTMGLFLKNFMSANIEHDFETAYMKFCGKKPTISSLINRRGIIKKDSFNE